MVVFTHDFEWRAKNAKPGVGRSQFKAKIMVCFGLKPSCSVLIHILERGEAISTRSYI